MKACMNERDSDCIGHPILSDESDFRTSEYNIYWDGPVVYLLANWRPAGLALFDTKAWGAPEVHASAATEVLAGAHL